MLMRACLEPLGHFHLPVQIVLKRIIRNFMNDMSILILAKKIIIRFVIIIRCLILNFFTKTRLIKSHFHYMKLVPTCGKFLQKTY